MSSRLPAVRPKELLRALERAGFHVHHVTGSHYVLKHETSVRDSFCRGTIAILSGTLSAILDQAGLSADELRDLL